jgi:membrane protease YdiL (CAAX protease family)
MVFVLRNSRFKNCSGGEGMIREYYFTTITKRHVKKFATVSLLVYTVIIGLIIPLILLLKEASFNKDYYPTEFILFIAFLVLDFVSLLSFHGFKNKASFVKQVFRYLSATLITIGFAIQTIESIDFFSDISSASADFIVLTCFICFG